MNRLLCVAALAVLCASCAPKSPASTSASAPMGTISDLSRASTKPWEACPHRVPKETCALCNPELAPKFKAINDWCPEHDRPESQCLICNPELTFDPIPKLATTADVKTIVEKGEDLPSLEAHLVPGKVTVFDFYADWCAPCRTIDAHMFEKLNARSDIALRKINVVSWETPIAKRYMAKAAGLPYVVVYGKDGALVDKVAGLNLKRLDDAIAKGGAR